MPRDRKVLEEELDYLGPVAIAIFVDCGWIRPWPMSWSRKGLRALQQGFGRWNGSFQQLPLVDLSCRGYRVRPLEAPGAACWSGRRAKIPAGTNIPMVDDSPYGQWPRQRVVAAGSGRNI
jgi:hypothetical protein